MIVRSITISGWRCFLDQLTIGPFDDRLNIISAPNGTGKTTIFEALRRAFLDGHKSAGRDVEALRPWGREITPRVAVEFTSKGTDYRISKNFLSFAFLFSASFDIKSSIFMAAFIESSALVSEACGNPPAHI